MSDEKMLNAVEASELIGCHPNTLANWRAQRRGPPWAYVRIRGRRLIRYPESKLRAWIKREWLTA